MVLVRDPAAASDAVAAGLVGGYALQGDQGADFATQVASVGARLQGSVPLFVASDEEGGSVQRLRTVLGRYPAQSTVAARDTPEQAGAAFEAYARRAGALGVNMILGPVLDVGSGAGLGSRELRRRRRDRRPIRPGRRRRDRPGRARLGREALARARSRLGRSPRRAHEAARDHRASSARPRALPADRASRGRRRDDHARHGRRPDRGTTGEPEPGGGGGRAPEAGAIPRVGRHRLPRDGRRPRRFEPTGGGRAVDRRRRRRRHDLGRGGRCAHPRPPSSTASAPAASPPRRVRDALAHVLAAKRVDGSCQVG